MEFIDFAPRIVCEMSFADGENDDIGRVINRALGCLESIHPVFHNN